MQPVIVNVWLNDEHEMPEKAAKLVSTQDMCGFKRHTITLDNFKRGIPYVEKAIDRKRWVKAADYLRADYLYNHGGLYFDIDIEVSSPIWPVISEYYAGSNVLCEREPNGFISNGFILAAPGNKAIRDYMLRAESGAWGVEDMPHEEWHCGMGLWTVVMQEALNNHEKTVHVLDPMTLFTKSMHHHYLRSWVPENERKFFFRPECPDDICKTPEQCSATGRCCKLTTSGA